MCVCVCVSLCVYVTVCVFVLVYVYVTVCVYVWLFVQADKRAKCPACGHRQEHPIAWNAELRRLIHQCAFCKALFSEPPVVQAQEWEVISPFMEPTETEEKFQPYSGASREPVLHPMYRQK